MQHAEYCWEPWEKDGYLHIPDWCYEDTPLNYDSIEDDVFIRKIEKADRVSIDKVKYRDIRRTSYFACRWYPALVTADIPTIPSVLARSSTHDLRADLKELMSEYPTYRFVRLCGNSPKDVVEVPIFHRAGEAADAIFRSQRTLSTMQNYDHCHLFLRKDINIHNECRCFIHKRRLRAVSVYNAEENTDALEASLLAFFDRYAEFLPYNSCVAEVGWTSEEYVDPFIIEFNSFGVDGFAGSSLFDWDSEQHTLYLSTQPEFRYPNL